MTEIILATTNDAKVKQLQSALSPIGVTVNGVPDKSLLPEVIEDGDSAEENARKKALIYAKALGKAVLSMDNTLYFDGVSPDEQPGIHIRQISPVIERASDQEVISHYAKLIAKYGETMQGHWRYGLCFAKPTGEYREAVLVGTRMFTCHPSARMIPGYPMESLQIDQKTGKYVSEMTDAEKDVFWQTAVGAPIQEFIKSLADF